MFQNSKRNQIYVLLTNTTNQELQAAGDCYCTHCKDRVRKSDSFFCPLLSSPLSDNSNKWKHSLPGNLTRKDPQ